MKKRIVNMILSVVLAAVMGCNASEASTSKVLSNDLMNDNVGIGVMQMVNIARQRKNLTG